MAALLPRPARACRGPRHGTPSARCCGLLRRPADEVDDLLGDAVYVSVPRLLIGLFDGDADALLALATDAKGRRLRAQRGPRGGDLSHLAGGDRSRSHAAISAGVRQRALGGGRSARLVFMDAGRSRCSTSATSCRWSRRHGRAGRIDRSIQEWSDFGKDLARAHTAYDDARRFEDLAVGPIDDIVAELDWTRHGAETVAEDRAYDDAVEESAAPASNPFRGIGRNDPCPCGSGRKAKKCCLGSA